jgi:hypothetical protein
MPEAIHCPRIDVQESFTASRKAFDHVLVTRGKN